MRLGSFTLIKNEVSWIGAHIQSWIDNLEQMVFFDGNSTDGTLDIIHGFINKYGGKIKLFKNKDPNNLEDDYIRLFNECMWSLDTDMAIYIHPDMILKDKGNIDKIPEDCICASYNVKSFAGEPNGELFEIVKGRYDKWKSIYRLRNPNLGAHYYGNYGQHEEDVYFKEITGNSYELSHNYDEYPYYIFDTKAVIYHYSDVRPLQRRIERMKVCLKNQGHNTEIAEKLINEHPRITFKSTGKFVFKKAEYLPILKEWGKQ